MGSEGLGVTTVFIIIPGKTRLQNKPLRDMTSLHEQKCQDSSSRPARQHLVVGCPRWHATSPKKRWHAACGGAEMCQAVGSDSESAEKPSNWWSIHKALDSDQGSIHCKFSIQATLSEFYQICTCRTNMQVSSSPHAKFSTACPAQHRIWASDRRFRHGLQDSASACYFCLQGEDIADHVLVQSAKQIWYTWFLQLQFDASIPEATHTLHEWWQDSRQRRRFDRSKRKIPNTMTAQSGSAGALGCSTTVDYRCH
jgi:hypothetical protein